jgi:hypothetical protein
VLYRNVYGWFDRIDRGLYDLRPQGRAESGEYPALAAKYRKLAQAHEHLAAHTPGANGEE